MYKPKGIAHTYSHTAYFADTDQAGVVHHSNYIRYFEAARIDFLKKIGSPYKDMQKNKIGFVPIELTIRYKNPLRLEDIYEVKVWVQSISHASIQMNHEVTTGKTLCCTSSVKLACVDESNFKVTGVPKLFLNKLKIYEDSV